MRSAEKNVQNSFIAVYKLPFQSYTLAHLIIADFEKKIVSISIIYFKFRCTLLSLSRENWREILRNKIKEFCMLSRRRQKSIGRN